MAFKDLSAYLTPNLDLSHAGKVYSVPPPSKDDGLKLATAHAYSAALVAHGPEKAKGHLSEAQVEIVEALKNTDIGRISLGPVYDEMVADKVPGPHIDMYARYALYFWVLGEATADEIMEALKGGGAEDPKAPARARSKSGQSTGSASRKTGSTGSRSTPTTGSRKAPRSASPVKKKAPESAGETSSNTGT